jgi:predicted PurR-regulated permease PerM
MGNGGGGDEQPRENGGDAVLGLSLGPVQARLIRYALAGLAALILGALLFLAFLILRAFVLAFSQVIWPLAVAGILALLLRPLVELMHYRLRLPRVGAILLLYALVVIVAGALVFVGLTFAADQIAMFLERLPALFRTLVTEVETRFPEAYALLRQWLGEDQLSQLRTDAVEWLKSQAGSVGGAVSASGQSLLSFFGTVAAAAVVPVYLYFFLETRHYLTRDLDTQLDFLHKGPREDLIFLLGQFVGIIVTFFRGQLVIAVIMGLLFGAGYQLVGLKFGFFIGLASGFLNIVPYLGSIIGLSMAIPLAYLQQTGGIDTVALVLVVFAAVQTIEGYLLTPKIMGNRTGLHPVLIIVAIFFWGKALGGILGMVLAIPLTAFFVVFWRLLREKYLAQFKPADGEDEPSGACGPG